MFLLMWAVLSNTICLSASPILEAVPNSTSNQHNILKREHVRQRIEALSEELTKTARSLNARIMMPITVHRTYLDFASRRCRISASTILTA